MARNNQLELLFDAPPGDTGGGAPEPLFAHSPPKPDVPTEPVSGSTSDSAAGVTSVSTRKLESDAASGGVVDPRQASGRGVDDAPSTIKDATKKATERFDLMPSSGSSFVVPTPCPPSMPPNARWRAVQTPQQEIGFVLLRSRRRTIGFVISDDGLRVTAPNWVTLRQVDESVLEKAGWILSKLRDWQKRREQLTMSQTQWCGGGELPYLGKRVVLELGSRERHATLAGDVDAPRDGDMLRLALPADADASRIRDAAQAWLQQRAGVWFGARLAHFLQASGLKISRWRLSSAATRWGSCTSDGKIMLNWRLIHFAPSIIDYVIAHELAHLREMNHSSNFWTEVGQILPDYQQARDVLRRHDPAMLPQF